MKPTNLRNGFRHFDLFELDAKKILLCLTQSVDIGSKDSKMQAFHNSLLDQKTFIET